MNELLASIAAGAYLRACNRVGAHPVLRGRPYIENYGRLELGDRFQLDSRPVQSHLVTATKGHLRIGNDVHIAFGAAIASHGCIRIGDRVSIGSYALIMDTDFHDPVNRDTAPEAGTITIGDDVVIGSRVSILRNTTIGAGASIAAGSVVSGDVPPGASVAGVPARAITSAAASPHTGGSPMKITAPPSPEIERRVFSVISRTFSLPGPPSIASGPHDINQWNSLGVLRLMLNLEEEFGISLGEHEMQQLRNTEAACQVVRRAVSY